MLNELQPDQREPMISPQSILAEMAQREQRQDATACQQRDVEAFLHSRGAAAFTPAEKMQVANRMGCYDAADLYKITAAQAA